MLPVAEADGVTLHSPKGGRYAFFNSPYPAHRLMTGLDIYTDSWFGDTYPSPISGTIINVRKVKAPVGRLFKDAGYDSIIVIKSEENPEKVVKILHIDTDLTPGDRVQAGDELGVTLRSGYFGFYTPAHAHVEIRPPEDPLRVRGGCQIHSLLNLKEVKQINELKGTVMKVNLDIAQVRLDNARGVGLPVEVDGKLGVLDGGIPTYGWVGAHVAEAPISGDIKLLDVPIARIINSNRRICIGNCTLFKVEVRNVEVGLHLTLQATGPVQVIISPRKLGSIYFKEGEEIEITLKSLGNA
jgi:hypothetical protein